MSNEARWWCFKFSVQASVDTAFVQLIDRVVYKSTPQPPQKTPTSRWDFGSFHLVPFVPLKCVWVLHALNLHSHELGMQVLCYCLNLGGVLSCQSTILQFTCLILWQGTGSEKDQFYILPKWRSRQIFGYRFKYNQAWPPKYRSTSWVLLRARAQHACVWIFQKWFTSWVPTLVWWIQQTPYLEY